MPYYALFAVVLKSSESASGNHERRIKHATSTLSNINMKGESDIQIIVEMRYK